MKIKGKEEEIRRHWFGIIWLWMEVQLSMVHGGFTRQQRRYKAINFSCIFLAWSLSFSSLHNPFTFYVWDVLGYVNPCNEVLRGFLEPKMLQFVWRDVNAFMSSTSQDSGTWPDEHICASNPTLAFQLSKTSKSSVSCIWHVRHAAFRIFSKWYSSNKVWWVRYMSRKFWCPTSAGCKHETYFAVSLIHRYSQQLTFVSCLKPPTSAAYLFEMKQLTFRVMNLLASLQTKFYRGLHSV